MKWKSNYRHPEGHVFEIEYELLFDSIQQEDYPAYYLIGVDGSGYALCNYMRSNYESAIHQALTKWGVPEDSWNKVEE